MLWQDRAEAQEAEALVAAPSEEAVAAVAFRVEEAASEAVPSVDDTNLRAPSEVITDTVTIITITELISDLCITALFTATVGAAEDVFPLR